MNITKKFDRAFQWAGEKMGAEAKTTMSDDFKQLEMEMALRFEGMDQMQRSMSMYVKWLGRRGEAADDKEKNLAVGYLGRTMVNHGEEFQPDSDFGNCLIAMGRANERVSAIQETFVSEATTTWLESLDRSLAMMKEYQAARKKLESRRLAYDASTTKMQKAKRDDFRLEEEQRSAKAKYEESSEDVLRRMQDIRDAESDSVRDLTQFLDAELDYHERCAEELRRVRKSWAAAPAVGGASTYGGGLERRPTGRSRSNTAQSFNGRLSRTNSYSISEMEEYVSEAPPVRMPARTSPGRIGISMQPQNQQPDVPVRPIVSKASTFQGGANLDRERIGSRATSVSPPSSSYGVNQNIPNVGSLRGQLRPVSRIVTTRDDVFADRDDDATDGSGSPDNWGHRSTSPTTSLSSLSRTSSNVAVNTNGLGTRKAPPPPPPSRSKKPPPPVPARREVGY
ncbi:Endophilin-A2 [Podospora aff. communis PSN243]|uniref:Endophilin-A2 n=1 Tax=Podospora aff. communis PSN243 TaxID=3040156 RepID=A0AAV9GHA4_9PEZI|nr:Endophilin-A2 [Podospora aff. communis PSN243]